MTDVRALLKAKRQEIKITHPLATYTSSGQLRCLACGTLVKNASAWEGHIGSKGHRTNVARFKEERNRHGQDQAQSRLRDGAVESEQRIPSPMPTGKRKAEGSPDGLQLELHDPNDVKRRRIQDPSTGVFPADFFSDPLRGPIPISQQSDDEDEERQTVQKPHPEAIVRSQIDLEYERFQQEVLGDAKRKSNDREAYERATTVAEPELTVLQESPLIPQPPNSQMDVDAREGQSDEESIRRRKEQEERELIMDRLLDEERAQEEADQRVTAMKARLEALKKKRGSTRRPAT